jgi:hypothetical protein
MKTYILIISAVILTDFAGVSFAETSEHVAKPVATQSLVEGLTQQGIPDMSKGLKAIDEAATKASTAKDAVTDAPSPIAKDAAELAKQPLKDATSTEVKSK